MDDDVIFVQEYVATDRHAAISNLNSLILRSGIKRHRRLLPFIETFILDDPRRSERIIGEVQQQDGMRMPIVHRCAFCRSCFWHTDSLRHHLESHAKFSCPKCTEMFYQSVEKEWHLRVVHGEKPLCRTKLGPMHYCRFCQVLGFSTREAAYDHVEKCHTEVVPQGFGLKKLDIVPKSSYVYNKVTVVDEGEKITENSSPNEPFYCELCNVFISDKLHFQHHNRVHRNLLEADYYACILCAEQFETIESHAEHLQGHAFQAIEGTGKFDCVFCKKSSTCLENLTSHLWARHARKQPLLCQYCEDPFPDQLELWKHYRNAHRMVKALKCTSCGQPFPSQAQRRKHVASEHS